MSQVVKRFLVTCLEAVVALFIFRFSSSVVKPVHVLKVIKWVFAENMEFLFCAMSILCWWLAPLLTASKNLTFGIKTSENADTTASTKKPF